MKLQLIFDILAVGWNHHCSENPAYSKIDLHKAEGRKYLFLKRRLKKRFLIYMGIQLLARLFSNHFLLDSLEAVKIDVMDFS